MNRPASFALDGPLPTGLTVLEASAGTGKTFALAALATRAVAERGLRADELCIVSFTEAATAELRGRIRQRMAEAAAHLAVGAPATDDVVLTSLSSGTEADRVERHERLQRAVADFDAATISTIHGFCARVVAAGGTEAGLVVADADVAEVVNDVVLARYGHDPEGAPAPRKRLVQAVELRLQLPDAALSVHDPGAGGRALTSGQQACVDRFPPASELVEELVALVRQRRRRSRRRTFDDLLLDARGVLTSPTTGPAAVGALRDRFALVLIDEFQDTDQLQWDIFRTAFLDPVAALEPVDVVLVGDPKQSIYRFRSAELSAYLLALDHAAASGGTVAGLDTNWRSDRALLDALDEIFAGYRFGDERVAFQSVLAARPDAQPGLTGLDPCSLHLRELPAEHTSVPAARAAAIPDLVAQVIELLAHARVPGSDGEARPLRASDIGVLVRSNKDATTYAHALAAAGVPAASSSSDSVLDSVAADQWRTLLTALERPTTVVRARAAALGWFVGLSAGELAVLDDDGMGDLTDLLRTWASALVDGGIPALLAAAREHGLARRVLSRPGGDRDLTDLGHVAELLQSATAARPVGASALLAALADLAAGRDDSVPADEVMAPDVLARRIDRDDDTVKVLTVHKAKGLEFPVVLCPTLWTGGARLQGLPHAFLDGVRRIDTVTLVGGKYDKGPLGGVRAADAAERSGEDRRLLYVALTRAKHRLVVWWSDAAPAPAPLRDLLTFAGGGVLDLPALAADSDGGIAHVAVPDHVVPNPWTGARDSHRALAVAEASRELDRTWRIWSFSAVKGAAEAAAALRHGEPVVVSDAPVTGGTDEPSLPEAAEDAEPPAGAVLPEGRVALPLQGAPGGTAFGTLVHSVLERVDFAATDLRPELRELCAESLHHRNLPITPDDLTDGLLAALQAPLGGPVGARSLTDLTRVDRLDELDFDLPLAGLSAARIAEVLLAHLSADDLLRPWAEAAAGGDLDVDVAGMLTGSIDLVARSGATGPFWLADYKSNFLPDSSDYGATDLAEAMVHHDYPLQATLYLVALHRYLRWRVPGYQPDRDLVGAAYLFLRGMDPHRPADDTRGVFWWRPPTAAIEALDRLLATGEVAA